MENNHQRYNVTLTHPTVQNDIDEFEIGEIHIYDNETDKDYEFTVWMDEETFNTEYVEDNAIGATYIWSYYIDRPIALDTFNTSDDLNEYLSNQHLQHQDIYEFVNIADGAKVEHALLQHHATNQPFSTNLSSEELQKIVPYHIAHMELADLTMKAYDKSLTKEDILSFAKTIDNPDLNFKNANFQYLAQPLTDILINSSVTSAELNMFKSTFEKLDLATDHDAFKQSEKKLNNKTITSELER